MFHAAALIVLLSSGQIAPAPPDAAEAAARSVVQDMSAREFEKVVARFDQKMAAALTAGQLSEIWAQLTAQLGAFKSITSVAVESVGPYRRALVTCAFEQSPLLLVWVFDAEQRISGFSAKPAATVEWTAPPYVNPSTFDEREITIGDRFRLPATVTMPKGNGPFPAIVLVHGSGPNDRDETLGGSKLFKDLAWGLASRGIAVLRYEKRTFALPRLSSEIKGFTAQDEVLDDVREAVTALSTTAGVDPERIVVAGHSFGGTLAPRAAAADLRISRLVLLAGAARPIEDALLDQLRYLKSDAQTVAAAEQAAAQIRSPALKPEDQVDVLGSRTPGSYWLDLRSYRPVETAATLTIPMLVLQGGRDYQVTSADFDAWTRGLKGRATVTLKLYPLLNHLFIEGAGPSRPEEYARPGHASEEVVRDIAAFASAR